MAYHTEDIHGIGQVSGNRVIDIQEKLQNVIENVMPYFEGDLPTHINYYNSDTNKLVGPLKIDVSVKVLSDFDQMYAPLRNVDSRKVEAFLWERIDFLNQKKKETGKLTDHEAYDLIKYQGQVNSIVELQGTWQAMYEAKVI